MTLTGDPTATSRVDDLMPPEPAFHHAPLRIADDVFMIRQLQGEGTAPMCMFVNSMVIAGKEPIIIDTGTVGNRDQWLHDVFSIVDPDDVRWIFISHDDNDHLGNLKQVLALCPKATLVVDWLIVERLASELRLPITRMRWVDDGEHFTTADRTLLALRPPTYDSPATRGLYDTKSGVYWSSDSFGAAIPHHVESADDLPFEAWSQGFMGMNRILSPWTAIVNPAKFADRVKAVQSLDASTIATCHGPVIRKAQLTAAYELMTRLPEMGPVPMPGQADLEAMLAAITNGKPG